MMGALAYRRPVWGAWDDPKSRWTAHRSSRRIPKSERDDHDIPHTAPRPNGRMPRHDAPGLDARYRPGSFHFRLTQATPGPRLFGSCPQIGGAPSVPPRGPSLAWFAKAAALIVSVKFRAADP